MSIRFVLLTDGAAFNVFAHELHKPWPSELSSNKLTSLEITGVTSSLMVMTMDEDGTVERIIQGNIDATFVCQNMVVKLPVGKM